MASVPLSITGTVLIDIRDAEGDSVRARCGAIHQGPPGARVILIVGALAVDPAGADAIRMYADRHEIEVQGTAHAVKRWVEYLRYGPGVVV